MKQPVIFFFLVISMLQVCAQPDKTIHELPELKAVFEKYRMSGTIIILDRGKNELVGYKPALWDSSYLPASTFKIVNTLIGLETGVIDTAYVFKWDGRKRRISDWDKDLTLTEAFRVSCVPCYQELARKIGVDRMTRYLRELNYGHMDVHPENIDLFWLEGNSRITPRQQVDFLNKLYDEKLPLSLSVMKSVKAIMINEKTPEYSLSGKTGWAIRNNNNYGWFVGYFESAGKVYFVATLIEPNDQQQVSDFALARKTITMDVFRILGWIR